MTEESAGHVPVAFAALRLEDAVSIHDNFNKRPGSLTLLACDTDIVVRQPR